VQAENVAIETICPHKASDISSKRQQTCKVAALERSRDSDNDQILLIMSDVSEYTGKKVRTSVTIPHHVR